MANFQLYALSVASGGCSDGDPYSSNESDNFTGYNSSSDACTPAETSGISLYVTASSLTVGQSVTTSSAINIISNKI